MYSASIEDCATKVCFLLFQEIAPPAKVNKQSDVDFLSSRSPCQSASVYPCSIR
uniref:Uncharacterized protein n=1 Tax=Triticum urartu TaxID=4572 RepID=A0A8R7TYB4_TRIUA